MDILKKLQSQFCKKPFTLIVAATIIMFMIGCFFVVHAKINGFLLRSGDTADAEQALWNATHGNGFLQGDLWDESDFREHLNFVQFLYFPFYKLFPNLLTLYAIIICSYAAAAWMLFGYAKSKIGELSAFVLTLLFLLNPIVLWQNLESMHVVAVAGPFLLFTLIFYERKQYGWWLFWLIVTASVSEFVAPTILMLTVLAWVQRRSWKWVLPPFFAGSAMLSAAHYYITLGYAQNDRLMDIFKNWDFLQNMAGKRLHMVEDFFKPVLYITPFFSWYVLLTIPTMAITFFAIDKMRLGVSPHLFVFIPTIIIFAVLDVLTRVLAKTRKLILAACVAGTILSVGMWNRYLDIAPAKNAKAMQQAAAMVPPSASVASFRTIATSVNHRKHFYFLDNAKYADYIILNTDAGDTIGKPWTPYIDSVKQSPDYRKIFDKDGISVYAKK